MRLTPLCAITLALSLCGTAAAQVGTLVRRDPAKDPCKRFKMRVLMPADAGTKPRPGGPVGPPDPGIIWDPCRGDVIQFAAVPVSPTPGPGALPAAPPFGPQPPHRGVSSRPFRAYSYSPPLR